MNFRTEKLILEGPDLTGKTSLYQKIHKETDFKWNIQDRSALSMICYARQFERCASDLRRDFYKEITCLNNRVVILLPDFISIIAKLVNKIVNNTAIQRLVITEESLFSNIVYLIPLII